jgi:YaiO family outer membrane protein
MKNRWLCILILGEILLPCLVAAQTPAVEGTNARPAATPEIKPAATIQPEPTPQVEIELGGAYESLTNDAPDWQTYFFRFNRKFSSGQVLYGEAAVVRRFNQTDPGFMIGLYQPLTKSRRWSATFEVSGSPTHDVLPAFAFYGQLHRNFGSGWVGSAGLRHSRYSENNANIGLFGVEKYIKAYRGAYTLYVAHLNGSGTSASHVFRGDYYYGERNSIGAGLAFGQEIESVGNGEFIRSDVFGVHLLGRHWFNQKWGMSYVALWQRQGSFYNRSGAQVGLLMRF